jgi:hypothetical protein
MLMVAGAPGGAISGVDPLTILAMFSIAVRRGIRGACGCSGRKESGRVAPDGFCLTLCPAPQRHAPVGLPALQAGAPAGALPERAPGAAAA